MKYQHVWKRVSAMVLAGILAGTMTACGGQTADESETAQQAQTNEASDKEYQVGVIVKTTASEYWSYVVAGAEAAAEDLGNVDAQIYGATADTDYEGQLNLAETILTSGTKQAIAIAPLNSGMAEIRASQATIPVLAVDTDFRVDERLSARHTKMRHIWEDSMLPNRLARAARLSFWRIFRVNLLRKPVSAAIRERWKKEAVKSLRFCTPMALVIRQSMSWKVRCKPIRMDAVVCCADDVALGAARAIEAAGRQDDGIIVCGFDGISSGVQAVVDGKISCTVAQDPYNMGYQAVQNIIDAINGEELPEFIDTGCQIITPDNAQEYLDKLNSLV